MLYKYCPFCGAEYDPKEEKIIKDYPNSLKCQNCNNIFYNNPKPTAAGLLSYKNKILLVKRKFAPYKDYWDLPGGFISFNETHDQAIKREMKEELGIDISINGIKGTFNILYPFSETDNFSVSVIVYAIQCENIKDMKCNDDVTDYDFFNSESMPKNIAFKGQQDYLKKYIFRK